MIIDLENVFDCFLRFVYNKYNLMDNNVICEFKSYYYNFYYRDNGVCIYYFVVFIFFLFSFCERY